MQSRPQRPKSASAYRSSGRGSSALQAAGKSRGSLIVRGSVFSEDGGKSWKALSTALERPPQERVVYDPSASARPTQRERPQSRHGAARAAEPSRQDEPYQSCADALGLQETALRIARLENSQSSQSEALDGVRALQAELHRRTALLDGAETDAQPARRGDGNAVRQESGPLKSQAATLGDAHTRPSDSKPTRKNTPEGSFVLTRAQRKSLGPTARTNRGARAIPGKQKIGEQRGAGVNGQMRGGNFTAISCSHYSGPTHRMSVNTRVYGATVKALKSGKE